MTSSTQTPRQKEFTGWHMLALMVAFFGVIISVNVFMALSSIRSWTGLVVENSYIASQEFNTKLANAKAQAAKGWQGGLEYSEGALRFNLVDGAVNPIPAETVIVDVSRPIGVEGDQTLTLTQQLDQTYSVAVDLDPGIWNAAIVVTFADQPNYEHHARLNVLPRQ